MAADDSAHVDILLSVEARAHEITESVLDRALSINEWTTRVRGAVTEARIYARTAQFALEEQSWIELAAIAIRRIAVLRQLSEDPDHVPVERIKP